MNSEAEKDIAQLNSFLRGERSAVETYTQCLEQIDDPAVLTQLRNLCRSHQERVKLLSTHIRALGGTPSEDSDLWGSFAKLAEGSAALFGKRVAVAALARGEDHGKADYERDLQALSIGTRNFIETSILPEQERSRAVLRSLKDQV